MVSLAAVAHPVLRPDNSPDEIEGTLDAELYRRIAEVELQLSREATAELDMEREQMAIMFEQKFEEWRRKEMENAVKVKPPRKSKKTSQGKEGLPLDLFG